MVLMDWGMPGKPLQNKKDIMYFSMKKLDIRALYKVEILVILFFFFFGAILKGIVFLHALSDILLLV